MFAHVLARLWERPDAITKEMPSHCGGEEKANVHFLCQLISGRAFCHCHARATVFSLYLSILISWVFFVQNGKSVISISFWNLKEIQCTVERCITTRHFHWKHFPALSLEPVLSHSLHAQAHVVAQLWESGSQWFCNTHFWKPGEMQQSPAMPGHHTEQGLMFFMPSSCRRGS